MVFKNEFDREVAVSIAKRMFASGKSVSEIAKVLCISEAKVRELKKDIDESEKY